jgi:phosphoesterase RecJ-like protein
MGIRETIACIKKHRDFLIASHTNMEGDALGSELGMYYLLKKLGKRATIVNDEPVPYGYDFLPGLSAIRRYGRGVGSVKFDCFVTVDCSDLRRTGEVQRLKRPDVCVLNVDHHVSNSYFGTVNWVDPEASCACEMVYRLFKAFKVPLDKKCALALYAGILTDTGSFRYSNTTAMTHAIAAELLRQGIDVPEVYRQIYASIPLEDLRLFARLLPTMTVEMEGKLAWFQVRKQIFSHRAPIVFDLSEGLLSFARTLKGIEVVVLFRENLVPKKEVRVNFRSQGAIDVNIIAKCFGGGGHPTASGATVCGKSLEEVRAMVLAKVRASVRTIDHARPANP